VGSLAFPSSGLAESAPWRGHHGHPVSLGVLTAFLWSCYAWFVGRGGLITSEVVAGSGNHMQSPVYFEVAAGVTVFLLAGRYFEARSKRRMGAALRALLDLGAPDAAVLRGGQEIRIPIELQIVSWVRDRRALLAAELGVACPTQRRAQRGLDCGRHCRS
jgi:cation transport ATPase